MVRDVQLNGNPRKEARNEVSQKMSALAARVMGKQERKSIPDDEEFATRWPRVWEWVTATQIGESIGKDPAKLSFVVSEGSWKLTLSDNALQCSLTSIGLTFIQALDALERHIVAPDAAWVQFKRKGKALRELTKEEKKSLDK